MNRSTFQTTKYMNWSVFFKDQVYTNINIPIYQYTNILLATKHSNMLMAIPFSKWKLNIYEWGRFRNTGSHTHLPNYHR